MITALRGGLPRGEKADGRRAVVLFEGLLPTVIPAIIIIGVVTGVMTPTESGAIASLCAFILGFFYLSSYQAAGSATDFPAGGAKHGHGRESGWFGNAARLGAGL